MVRGRDACWEHCVLVDATKQKVRCNYCQREFSGGVYRMKFHLAQIKNKDIVPCTEVPTDVRDHILSILGTPKKQKTPKKPKVDKAALANGQQNSSSASGDFHPNHASNGQNGSTCPSLLFLCPSPISQQPVDDVQKQKQDLADKRVAVFFFHNSIPFSAAKSVYYREMVDAVAECGGNYKAPSYEVLKSTLLEKVKNDIHDCYKKYRDEWKETGCTILCDSWSDGRNKSLVIFSVTYPKGTLFLKSVDLSGHEDDANYLFALLESVVLDVGVENVVQVITDTSSSYVYAGRLLMSKYNSLFWSPCASYCINKMLEDIGKQEWVCTVLEEARTITRFICSHAWTLSMMRKFAGGRELVRPKITRFVTNFLNLRSIVIQEDNLKHMFSHTEWLSSVYSRRPEAQAVKSLLYLERFWKHAQEAVTIAEPLVKILRIVDGDMPAMGYIYEGIERAKIAIQTHYNGIEEKYMLIWDIIDRRWSMQLHSSLHTAAASLNPSLFYTPNFKIDLRMRNGFQETMLKMATTHEDKLEITKEHPVYVNAQGALGTDFAIMGRTLNAPGDWWAGYGYQIPTLQRYAVRILSQPCSSHWCCWNWSTFESIHTKKHNRIELEKFNDLVFMHCNLWLQCICQNREGKCKPIVFDEIDVSSEWPTELESPAPNLNDSLLDSLPLDVEDMVVGGTDTSSNTIEFAMSEILNKPQVLEKAQQELEAVVGKDSIVEESHIHKLPYLHAVMKETLRLHPVLPLLVPHCPSETCTVGGYTIPKGSRIFVNVWAIHRDPSSWENPLKFDPNRFLDSKWDYSGSDFNYFPFGSGRRICAGMAMAERMVMHSLATLVHSFDWKLPQGDKLDLSEKFGIVLKKKIPLVAIPTPRLSDPALYE